MTAPATEEPIVIHGPLTGLPEMLAGHAAHEPATVTLPELQPGAELPERTGASAAEPSAAPVRSLGLDAFRGFLLLAMNFAFTIPFGPFPKWMYHMQNPPPNGDYLEIPGLTWRDLLFAGFLFTMAAAIPVTMSMRLEKRVAQPEIIWIALRRGFLLFLFALIIGQVNPYWTKEYTRLGNVMAIGGFLLAFALLLRPRSDWNPVRVQWLRYTAWLGVLTLFLVTPALYGASFSLERRDGVIAAIAFCVVIGTILWLATRTNWKVRLLVLAAILIVRTAARQAGWASELYYFTPAPWLYEAWYLELLFLVIPGTIAGDLLVAWRKRAPGASTPTVWSKARLTILALMLVLLVPVLCTGLYLRELGATMVVTFALLAAGALLTRNPQNERDRLIVNLYRWAALWLVIGLVLEPFEGGIKKAPQTLSYLTLMAGLSTAFLLSMVIVVDMLKAGSRWLKPLVEIGQNPLMAYVIYMLFLTHILYLAGVGDMLSDSSQQAMIRGFLLTGVSGALVWLATRKRLLWRA